MVMENKEQRKGEGQRNEKGRTAEKAPRTIVHNLYRLEETRLRLVRAIEVK